MLRAALQKADEQAVLELLAADASAISEVTLPLHTACRKKALCTGRLIAALLKVRPDGAQQLDGEGLLPLHIAARSCAPVDVLELLIQAYPDGMRAMDATSYRLPLHFACTRKANLECIRVLLAANPVAASYEDGDAHTPAQLAASHGAGEEAVQLLMAAAAAASAHLGPTQPCRHFNTKLRANNVWEVDLPLQPLAEALDIFERCELRLNFERLRASTTRHRRFATPSGRPERFFGVRAGGYGGAVSGGDGMAAISTGEDAASGEYTSWASDITWVSVDDEATHAQFERLFRACDLEAFFGPICGCRDRLRMFSASYVVRSRCETPNFHYDYISAVGARALTLMAPLKQYSRPEASNADLFQLLYEEAEPASGEAEACTGEAEGDAWATRKSKGAGGGRIRRQEYAFGKAVVFGAGFRHSTEPGSSTEPGGEPHVFLCFTFGTDRQEAWPLIAQTIDGDQSRMLCRPDGEIVLTQLGRSMQKETQRQP